MICRLAVGTFLVLYLVALALLAIGTWGLVGQEQDPLAGVFLLPLGLPWTALLSSTVPVAGVPWLGALAPLINLLLLGAVCRWTRSRRGK